MLNKSKTTGFTLVEMAIVLVIVGIILAGVMKGRDIVRGAQVKKYSQHFIQKWPTIMATYKDKTGQVLFDGNRNGSPAANAPDGVVDAMVFANSMNGSQFGIAMINVLRSNGITPCHIVKTNLSDLPAIGAGQCANNVNPFECILDGEFLSGARAAMGLQCYTLNTPQGAYTRNTIVYTGVPADIAQGLDTAIDGKVNGRGGSCVCIASYPNGAAPASWNVNWSAQTIARAVNTINWPAANDTNNALVTLVLVLDAS